MATTRSPQRRRGMTVATADMWFDPRCPWAWLASRWLLEVQGLRDVKVRFHVMSLSVLNEGRPGFEEEYLRIGWGPVRVAIATELAYGAEALAAIYTAMGTLIHREKAPI